MKKGKWIFINRRRARRAQNRAGGANLLLRLTGSLVGVMLAAILIVILSGMGVFPPPQALKTAEREQLAKVPLDHIKHVLTACMGNHMPQQEALALLDKGEDLPLPHIRASLSDDPIEALMNFGFAVSSAN